MKEEDKEYIRAFAAMFAMNGLLVRQGAAPNYHPPMIEVIEEAFDYADAFMTACDWRTASGIAAIKPRKKYERKS